LRRDGSPFQDKDASSPLLNLSIITLAIDNKLIEHLLEKCFFFGQSLCLLITHLCVPTKQYIVLPEQKNTSPFSLLLYRLQSAYVVHLYVA